MLTAVWRKLGADIRSQKLQFILIWGVLALSAMLLTISLLVLGSANEPWQKTFEATNGPHIWIITRLQNLDFSQLTNNPAVTQSTGVMLALAENPLIIQDNKHPIFLYAMDQPPVVAHPLIADGRWLEPSSQIETVLDYSLARFFRIQVGDEIKVIGSTGEYPLKVVGLAVTAHWFPYDEVTKDISPGVAYISRAALQAIQPESEYWYSVLGLRLQEPEKSKQFVDQIHAMYPGQLRSVIEWQWVEQNATLTNQINVLFMGFFSILGLVAVSLIIFNTIGGQLLSHYREIGLLKAVGLKPIQVTMLFLSEHLFIGLLASIVGIPAGVIIAPALISPIAENLNTLPPDPFAVGPLLTVLLMVGGAVSLATLIPALRGGHINTVEALTVGYRQQYRSASRLGKLAVWLRLPPVLIVGIKDTFTRPLRLMMAISSLILTIMIAITSIQGQITTRLLSQNLVYFNGTSAEMKIERNFIPYGDINSRILSNPEVSQSYDESLLLGQAPGHGDQPIFFRLLSGGYQNFDFQVKEGRMISEPGEAVVGYAVLNMLGAEVGDEINLIIEGQPVHLKIVGRYSEWFNNGFILLTSLEGIQAAAGTMVQPQSSYLRLTDARKAAALRTQWMDQFQGLINISLIKDEPQSSASQLVSIIAGLGIIMLIVAGVNLMTTTLLNIRERIRDFGIQKTLGMTPAQIAWSVVIGAIAIALISLVIGIPLGVIVMEVFVRQVGITIGAGPDFFSINWAAMSFLLPVLVLVASLSSLLPALSAARLQIIDALRYE